MSNIDKNKRKEDWPAGVADISELGEQEEVERDTRGGWRWWWVWPIIFALVFWWAGWGWGGTGGWWWGRVHSQNTAINAPAGARTTETLANVGAEQPLTSAGAAAGGAKITMAGPGVRILTSPDTDKVIYVGQRFQASNVPVVKKVNARAMWIGQGNPMLAIAVGPTRQTVEDLKKGKEVNAEGTVRPAPTAAEAKHEWALSDKDASKLEDQKAYIELSHLSVHG
jgi:hypothetical protein